MAHTYSRALGRLAGLLVLAFSAAAPAAWAAPAVTSQLEVRQVVIESGHELLKPASAARPGDLLQYRAVYSNSGNQPAGHLLASLPVPPGTTLQSSGIEPGGAQATLDGNHFAPMPLMRSVPGKDGQPHQQPVPLSEIRALRWDLGTLAPRETRAVQLRVHVNQPIAAPAAAKPAPTTGTGAKTSP